MHTELYLDTARLGRMCRGARTAEQGFVALVSQLRSPLYFERFLTNGFHALSSRDRHRFPALRCWPGFIPFKSEFGRFVSQPSCPTFQFSTSQSLIRFAAECLFDSAGTVLATDLAWPPYLDVLYRVAKQQRATLHVVPLRQMVFDGGASVDDAVRVMIEAYHARECDGLFLSDINYLGVRLPLREIQCGLASYRPPFVVLDGAQALGQRPIDIQQLNCDLYLTGTQKWFAAYHPLRLAFVGRRDSLSSIRAVRGRLSRSWHFYDPLLDFSDEVERNEFRTFGETVNLIPLITAAGALRCLMKNREKLEQRWQTRRQNARAVADALRNSFSGGGQFDSGFESGILLVASRTRTASDDVLTSVRSALNRYRISATVFPNGDVRFAMPNFTMPLRFLSRIEAAVQHGYRRQW